MTDSHAVFRARLGAALRALPSELLAEPVEPRVARLGAEIFEVARQLERVSPGLPLMMQLRARLFDDAVIAASRRGFEQVVTIGCGFERRRLQRHTLDHLRLVEVEHPAVQARAARRATPGTVQVSADDFEHGAWSALGERGFSPRDRKTLLLIQGLSLWGSATTLEYWLDRLGEQAAMGGELLLNLLDGSGADHARRASDEIRGSGTPPAVTIRFGIDGVRLLDQIAARRLHLLRLFDSHDLQRRRFGVEDLLVREVYAWVAASDGASAALAGVRRWATPRALAPVAARRLELRPRLRPDLRVDGDGTGPAMLSFPVTGLRACGLAVTSRDLAAASLFDGRHGITEIVAELASSGGGYRDADVSGLAHHLGSHGMLAFDAAVDLAYAAGVEALNRGATDAALMAFLEVVRRERVHLGALRELGFYALERRDEALMRRVSRMLTPACGNPAAAHLRELVRIRPLPLLRRKGPVAVVMAPWATSDEAHDVIAAAHAALAAAAHLLDVSFPGTVVIDVSSPRSAIPTTTVSDAEPYTLVRIPRPSYSPSILSHELTHVLAMSGSTWLSEGLAVWIQRRVASGTCFPDDVPGTVSSARPSLPERLLSAPPAHGEGAREALLDRAAYRDAAAFVDWMVSSFGMPGFRRLFAACRRPATIVGVTDACRALGFRSIRHLEDDWWRVRS